MTLETLIGLAAFIVALPLLLFIGFILLGVVAGGLNKLFFKKGDKS